MKKAVKLFSLIIILIMLPVWTGCGERKYESAQAMVNITTEQPPSGVPTQEPLQVTETVTLEPTKEIELTVTPTPTPTSTPTPAVKEVSMVSVGDDLIHKTVVDSGLMKDGSYNYDHLYVHLKDDFENADLAIMNQETILGTKKMGYSGYPRFNSPVQIGDALRKAGFDVILHATNHVMDMGIAGIENTLEYWSKHPEITVVGIHSSIEDSKRIAVVEKNGIKIAMLNYTYGTNGISVPKNKTFMIDQLNKNRIKRDIEEAKKEADFIIVFPHWGTEYVYKQNKYQEEWAKFFAEQGVDLVIGTHPHVLQPVEWVKGANGHNTLVYYSLGNYVSTMNYTDRMLGGMARVTIVKDKKGTYIKKASMTPIVTHYERGKNTNLSVYKLSEYTEELAKKHYILKDNRGKDFSIKKLNELADEIIGVFREDS